MSSTCSQGRPQHFEEMCASSQRTVAKSNPTLKRVQAYLVGGCATPLSNMKVSWDNNSQYMENETYSKPPIRYTDVYCTGLQTVPTQCSALSHVCWHVQKNMHL